MKYIIVFIAFFSSNIHAQDTPVFDEPTFDEPVFEEDSAAATPEDIEEAPPLDLDAIESQISEEDLISTSQDEEGEIISGDFEVFRPSEEISEDLSVPFPADI